jgi:hypothetical protein
MPIQPNDMLTIGLPAAYWDWLLSAARSAPAPHEQSDPVIQALNGQMRAHLERAQAADALAAAPTPAEPAAPPSTPTAPRKRK